jgi:mannose-1-phosphate guanylyltransferase/RNA polymerase-binding transcription factor DksA
MVPHRQTFVVVTKTHEPFYAEQVAGAPASSLLVQPFNKGTAPAIVYALMRLRELDRTASVGFFPSDHFFADEEAFIAHVDSAFNTVESRPGLIVLLGIAPNGPEAGYGWIEPGAPVETNASGSVFRVTRFWEKPSLALASGLMERGCLWNSFVMVGEVDSFLNLIRRALPNLIESFEWIRPTLRTPREEAALLDLYAGIPASDFSGEVLSAHPDELAVLCGKNLGWSDLGETGRVLSVLGREGIKTGWGLGYAEEQNAATNVLCGPPDEATGGSTKKGHSTMNSTQSIRLKIILESRLEKLSGDVRNRDRIAIERAADTIDEVQFAEERDLAMRILDRDFAEIRLVKAALASIKDGTYGSCLRCDGAISLKRLLAVPHAAFCVTCQEKADLDDSGEFRFLKQLAEASGGQ